MGKIWVWQCPKCDEDNGDLYNGNGSSDPVCRGCGAGFDWLDVMPRSVKESYDQDLGGG